jgi:hypothetical protein
MTLNESFTAMSRDFRLSTWIDHGYDNGRKSNREDVVCDGFVQGSPLYAAGLFKEFNVKNVWNCFYEDSSFYGDAIFNAELVTPHPAFGHAYPRPSWWRHPTVTGTIRHFRTTCTLAPRESSMWDYYLSEGRLKYLADSRGVYVAHLYPARMDSASAFIDWNDPVWTINPAFDRALGRLAGLRDGGRIWVPTIRDYLEYVSERDAVVCTLSQEGSLILHHSGTNTIKGLSMAVEAEDVQIEGKVLGKRKVGDELLFWFDMNPLETLTIRVLPKR